MDEKFLLQNLLSENAELRHTATHALWNLWFNEYGENAASRIRAGTKLMENHQFEKANEVFKNLIAQHPSFAEAHNKLATSLFMQGEYSQSVIECEITLKLNPYHFGAWNGLGLCLFHLARYQEAIKSFQTALTIQPYADINKSYIAKCRGQLN